MKARKGDTIYNFDLGFVKKFGDIGIIFEELEKASSSQACKPDHPLDFRLTWGEAYDGKGRLLRAGLSEDWLHTWQKFHGSDF